MDEGYSGVFYVMLVLGIVGVVGFFCGGGWGCGGV